MARAASASPGGCLKRCYVRPLAIAGVWLVLVTLATYAFFAPRGIEAQPRENDFVAFALALGIAGASASALAFALAGRLRWAVELTGCVVVVLAVVAALAGYLFWVDIRFVRGRLDYQTFAHYQAYTRIWAEQGPGFVGPFALGVGLLFGLLAGAFARLARRARRLATAAGVGVLLAFASEPGRLLATRVATRAASTMHYFFVPWTIADDQITIAGTLLGAAAGAVIAGLALHFSERTRTARRAAKPCSPPSTSGTGTPSA